MATDAPSEQVGLLGRQIAPRRLGRAVRAFATSEVGGRAMALAASLITLLLTINGLNVLNSYVARIADDVRSFTSNTLSLALIFTNGTLTILAFFDRASWVLRALAERGVAYVVLGDGTLPREHFDAIAELAPDGTWSRRQLQEGTQ